MGCSASKYQLGRDEKNVPLTPSLFRSGSSAKVEGGSPGRSPRKASNRGNGVGGADVYTAHGVSTQQARSSSKLKPLKEEDFSSFGMPTKQTSKHGSERMDALLQGRNYAQSDRFASYGCLRTENSDPRIMFLGRVAGNESARQKSKSVDNTFVHPDSKASSFRVMESMDGKSGLRILLSPAATPSRSFTSSTKSGTSSKMLSSSGWVALSPNNDSPRMLATQAALECKVVPLEMEGMGDSEEPGSPLFDPSILATFEKAIEASSKDYWHASDVTSSSSSRIGCLSSDTRSDAESLNWPRKGGLYKGVPRLPPFAIVQGTEGNTCKVAGEVLHYRSNGLSKKKSSLSKVTPLVNDAWTKQDYLEAFDLKCPPRCEDKIVLYFTSLRGIRKTYEDCCTVRLILKGFGVHVDERDVWMHSTFRQELATVLGVVLTVPRLFVKGRYIGGVEDVKHLHEEGILGNLLEGLPAELNGMCNMCGGVRFIPCTSCNGSCKLLSLMEVLRCPDCNENGLMMCPACYC